MCIRERSSSGRGGSIPEQNAAQPPSSCATILAQEQLLFVSFTQLRTPAFCHPTSLRSRQKRTPWKVAKNLYIFQRGKIKIRRLAYVSTVFFSVLYVEHKCLANNIQTNHCKTKLITYFIYNCTENLKTMTLSPFFNYLLITHTYLEVENFKFAEIIITFRLKYWGNTPK